MCQFPAAKVAQSSFRHRKQHHKHHCIVTGVGTAGSACQVLFQMAVSPPSASGGRPGADDVDLDPWPVEEGGAGGEPRAMGTRRPPLSSSGERVGRWRPTWFASEVVDQMVKEKEVGLNEMD